MKDESNARAYYSRKIIMSGVLDSSFIIHRSSFSRRFRFRAIRVFKVDPRFCRFDFLAGSGWEFGKIEPAGARIMFEVVPFVQSAHHHALALGCRVNEIAVPDINADVREAVTIGVLEEDQITRLQIGLRDGLALLILSAGGAGQDNSPLRVNRLNEAGAVETGARRTPAPPIRSAAKTQGGFRKILPACGVTIWSVLVW